MDGGRRILILAATPGPNLKITNSSEKSVKVLIYTNSSEIGESMSPLWCCPVDGAALLLVLVLYCFA